MTDYANILSALGKSAYQPQMDDLNRRSENFRIAEEMSSKGISLSDLTKRLGDLETKVGETYHFLTRFMRDKLFKRYGKGLKERQEASFSGVCEGLFFSFDST